MKVYYIGEIVFPNDVDLNYQQIIAKHVKDTKISYVEYIEKGYNKKTQDLLEKYMYDNADRSGVCFSVRDDEIRKILFDVCSKVNNCIQLKEKNLVREQIVYEIVRDKNNNTYAKEIYTGLLFPLEVKTSFSDFQMKFSYMNYKGKFDIDNYYYTLYALKKLNFPGFLSVRSFLVNNEVCNKNQLEEYLNQFKKGILNFRKKKNVIENIQRLAGMNVIDPEVKIQESEKQSVIKDLPERQKQSSETSCMENIDYLLSGMKVKNPNKYEILRQKYKTLLKKSNLTLEELAYLEGEIEFYYYLCNSEATDILENLTMLRKVYLTNMLENNPKNIDLTFKKINRINEIFLKVKNDYNLLSQREVLKNLSFLYLMEVYENRDTITLEELESSYFIDNLKSIMLCIKGLQESNLITCDLMCSLNEELTCEKVFQVIKTIKFNTLEKEEMQKIIKRI